MAPDTSDKKRPEREEHGTFHPDNCHLCQRKVAVRHAYYGSWYCIDCLPVQH